MQPCGSAANDSTPSVKGRSLKHDTLFGTAHLRANLGQRVLRGGAVTFLAQAVSFVLSTASVVLLARLLRPEDFGLIAMVAPIAGFLGFFRDMGLFMATVQQPEINHRQVSNLFWINLGFSTALMVVTAGLAPLVGGFYGRTEATWITLGYSVNFVISGVAIQHQALLKRQMAFTTLSGITLTSQVVGVLTAAVGALLGWQYWALVAMASATALTDCTMTWFFCKWRPGFPARGAGVRNMLVFGGALTGASVIEYAARNLDSIVAGRLFGANLLGYYNRAQQLYLLPIQQITGPLSGVAVPALSRLHDDPERYRRYFLQILERIALAAMPVAAVLVVVGDLVTRIFLGSRWDETGSLLRILALGGVAVPISATVSWLFVTQGRARPILLWACVGLTLRVIAVSVGAHWGIIGIATAIAANQYLAFFLFTLWAGTSGPVRTLEIWSVSGRVFLASASGAMAGLALRGALSGVSIFAQLPLVAALVGGVALGVFGLLPGGRASLLETLRQVRSLLARKGGL